MEIRSTKRPRCAGQHGIFSSHAFQAALGHGVHEATVRRVELCTMAWQCALPLVVDVAVDYGTQ